MSDETSIVYVEMRRYGLVPGLAVGGVGSVLAEVVAVQQGL